MLETEVDDRYYLSDSIIQGYLHHNAAHAERGNGFAFSLTDGSGIAHTILTSGGGRPTDNFIIDVYGKVIQVANIVESEGKFGNPQRGRVYATDGIAPTITTVTGGGLEPKIIQRARGFNRGGCHTIAPTITGSAFQENNFAIQPCALRGRENRQVVEFNGSDCANALTTVQKDSLIAEGWRIRKLTPRECFRLMGLSEPEINTIQAAGISNSQQYKLAGNSIVVGVLAKIFEQLLKFN